MALKIEKFNHLQQRLLDGTFDLDAQDLKVMLVGSGYAFDPTDTQLAELSAHEVAGTGYTAGGQVPTGQGLSRVASSAATAWAAGTVYKFGDIRRPAADNGHVYMCIVPGTSGGGEPAWPTGNYGTVDDNGVLWLEIGNGFTKFDADDTVWPNSTITARRAIWYRPGNHNGLTDPLAWSILLDDAPADVSSTNSNFTLQWPADGIIQAA